jgi:RND family efflux transporter MFP subunit
MNTLHKFISYVRSLPRLYSIGGAVLLVIVIGTGVHFIVTRAAPQASIAAQVSHVQVSTVAGLSSQTGPLTVTGTVTSLNQATILAQAGGEIVSLSHALGDHVDAGSVIAVFENSSQQAAVLQAQGAYDAAEAALSKQNGSSATNSSLSSSQAATAAANAASSVHSALVSVYSAFDDAVHTKADTLFSNPRGTSPKLVPITIPDSQLVVNIENERGELENVLSDAESNASASANLDTSISSSLADAQKVETFLNDIIDGVNKGVPNQFYSAAALSADQAMLSGARTEVVSAVSGLTSAKAAYDSAQSGAATAANTATAGTGSDIAAAQASVKQAQGALNAAQANLAKTIIRSPVSGTIVSLPITKGDYVNQSSQVAVVSNPHALQVDAYVTSDDAHTLVVGGTALVGDTTRGVITSIAPALDPTTGKIDVKIGIVGDQSALTDGETVTVTLTRSTAPATAASSSKNIIIPIAAAKITPQGPVIFTVSASSTLISSPITLGTIFGDQVTVLSGLTPQMEIVTDARGLTDGQTVVVDTH